MTQPDDRQKPLVTICAWCPTFDRLSPANKAASHGMCPPCCVKFNAELDALEAAK